MPDELPSTQPSAGRESSEYTLSKVVLIVGTAVAALGGVLEVLAQIGIGQHWVGVGLIVVGAMMKILRVAGYEKSRTDIKTEAIAAATAERQAVIEKAVSTMTLEEAEMVIKAAAAKKGEQ